MEAVGVVTVGVLVGGGGVMLQTPEGAGSHVEQLRGGHAEVGALHQVHPVGIRDQAVHELGLVDPAKRKGVI